MDEAEGADLTYAAHSEEVELVRANEAFLDRRPLDHVGRFLDLACGPGVVSEMLMARCPSAHLQGIDYDPAHVDLASQRFRVLGYEVRRGFDLTSDRVNGRPVLTFGVGSADELPFPDASFGCTTITNAIHLLPDKARLAAAVVSPATAAASAGPPVSPLPMPR